MPELEQVEKPKVAGFVDSRYTSKDRTEREEKELQALIEERDKKAAEPEKVEEKAEPEEHLSDEEKSFKTRYGDVRRHLAAKEKEFGEKIKELEEQLGQTKKLVPPKSDEDIAAWAKEYPDVAGIVETIADKRARQMFDKANIQIEELNKAKQEAVRSRAENEIREAHKDFDKLRDADEFHNWVDIQPKWVQNALYENTDDAASVVRVLDLYKIDKGLTPSDKKSKAKAAASLVDKGSKTSVDTEDLSDSIKESDIERMSARDFAANEEKIQKAMRSGKIIYDLSGNAR